MLREKRFLTTDTGKPRPTPLGEEGATKGNQNNERILQPKRLHRPVDEHQGAEAYEDGLRPRSKWGKADILQLIGEHYPDFYDKFKGFTAEELRWIFVKYEEWHHTGKFAQKTDFYKFDTQLEREELESARHAPKERKPRAPKEPTIYKIVRCTWQEWQKGRGRWHKVTEEAFGIWETSKKTKKGASKAFQKVVDKYEANYKKGLKRAK